MVQMTIADVARIHGSSQQASVPVRRRRSSSLIRRPVLAMRNGGNESPALRVRSPPISGAGPSTGRSAISIPRPAPGSARRDGSSANNGWRISAKQAAAPEALEACAGPAMAAFLAAKEAVTYFVALLANDAGKDPNNPLWMVGAAKLAFFGLLFMAYRVLQPQLDRYVERMQESRERKEQEFANGPLGGKPKTTGGYTLALMKAIQTSTKSLVPIMIGLIFVSNLSDFIEVRCHQLRARGSCSRRPLTGNTRVLLHAWQR